MASSYNVITPVLLAKFNYQFGANLAAGTGHQNFSHLRTPTQHYYPFMPDCSTTATFH